MCKVFENRSLQDEERMDQLTNQLKEARLLAEDADGKSDEVIESLCIKLILTQMRASGYVARDELFIQQNLQLYDLTNL